MNALPAASAFNTSPSPTTLDSIRVRVRRHFPTATQREIDLTAQLLALDELYGQFASTMRPLPRPLMLTRPSRALPSPARGQPVSA